MSTHDHQLILLGLAWGTYFAVHSVLASLAVKQRIALRWPQAMPAYRLVFNMVAILLLLPPAWLTLSYDGPELWAWTGPWFWVANGLATLAITGFIWSLRYYDSGEFLGLRQLRDRETSPMDQERFHISPLHRFVRHPWYFLGLVLLWTRDMDAARLLTVGLITAYFVFGSRLEERKLEQYHGDVYRHYRQQVPGLFPLPWRYLTRKAARELETAGQRH